MFLMAFLVISVKFGKHRPLPKRKEDAEKENYKRQNDICRSKCRNSKIFCCVPAYHSHSIIDYKKIHIHLLQFAFLLLILKIKQLYIILKSTTDRCSPKLFTKLSITSIQGCQLVPFACLVRPQVFYKPSCQTKSNFLLLNHHIIQVGSGPFLLRTLPVLDD